MREVVMIFRVCAALENASNMEIDFQTVRAAHMNDAIEIFAKNNKPQLMKAGPDVMVIAQVFKGSAYPVSSIAALSPPVPEAPEPPDAPDAPPPEPDPPINTPEDEKTDPVDSDENTTKT
jgi:hypothetical protein